MDWGLHWEDESIGVRHVFVSAEPLQSLLHTTPVDVRPVHGHRDGRNIRHLEHGDSERSDAKKNHMLTLLSEVHET